MAEKDSCCKIFRISSVGYPLGTCNQCFSVRIMNINSQFIYINIITKVLKWYNMITPYCCLFLDREIVER